VVLRAGRLTAGAAGALLLALGVPFVRGLFRLEVAHRHDLVIAAGLGLGALLWFELLELTRPRWLRAGA